MAPTLGISQALTSLLPSLPATNKPFPAALVSQCESLLALSRQRHPTLKPDEEIARAHACAEIACERLRAQLRLPAIKAGAGAPCKPTTYKKLIRFLDASLAVTTTSTAAAGLSTPKGRKRPAEGSARKSAGQRTPGLDESPSKKRGVEKPAGAISSTQAPVETINDTPQKTKAVEKVNEKAPFSRNRAAVVVNNDGDQDNNNNDIMSQIRRICKHFSTPLIAPHVYTGACIIWKLAGLSSAILGDVDDEEDAETRWKIATATFIVALYLMVLTKARKGPMTTAIYEKVLRESLSVLGVCSLDDIARGEEKAEKILIEVADWIDKFNQKGWCDGQDWWGSVPEDVLVLEGEDLEEEEVSNSNDEEGDETNLLNGNRRRQRPGPKNSTDPATAAAVVVADEEDPEGVLLPGLGTMLYIENALLTQEDKQEFEAWKRDVLGIRDDDDNDSDWN